MARVLFWVEQFWPVIGGSEVFSTRLLPALRARGHEFIVISGQPHPPILSSEAQYEDIPIYRFPFSTVLTDRKVDQILGVRQQVTKLKRTFAPDLIHIHGVATSVFFCLETRQVHPVPLLMTLTNEAQPGKVLGGEFLRRSLLAADWVTGKATAVLSQARQWVPEILPRSSVIHN